MYALEHLIESKGTIAVVTSLSGKFPVPNRTAYCSSKHGTFQNWKNTYWMMFFVGHSSIAWILWLTSLGDAQ